MKMYSVMNNDKSMMLDDESHIHCSNFQSVSAERLPMKVIRNLSDIWVPTHLLKKRNNYSVNWNKPTLFHTLNKTSDTSFSVYDDIEFQPENSSATEFAQNDMLELLNNYESLEAKEFVNCEEAVSRTLSEASKSCETQNIGNNDIIKTCDSDKFPSSGIENTSPRGNEKISETFNADLSDVLNYVQSACIKTNIKTNDESVSNSLDDIYNSDDDFFQEACTMSKTVSIKRYESLNANLNISTVEDVPHDKHLEPNPDFENYQQNDMQNANSKEVVEPECEETLVNFPIAYKRPVIEESNKKQKTQKKKKNAQKKTTLNVFSEDFGDAPPEVDEFYQSIMRREYQEPYECEYPTLQNEFQNLEQYAYHEFQTAGVTSEFKECAETGNPSGDTTFASENFKSPVTESLTEKGNHIILLENVPEIVTEEEVQAIVKFGEVISFINKCGGLKTAEVRMNSDTEADWLISCLDGYAVFGADTPCLKCYKVS